MRDIFTRRDGEPHWVATAGKVLTIPKQATHFQFLLRWVTANKIVKTHSCPIGRYKALSDKYYKRIAVRWLTNREPATRNRKTLK